MTAEQRTELLEHCLVLVSHIREDPFPASVRSPVFYDHLRQAYRVLEQAGSSDPVRDLTAALRAMFARLTELA